MQRLAEVLGVGGGVTAGQREAVCLIGRVCARHMRCVPGSARGNPDRYAVPIGLSDPGRQSPIRSVVKSQGPGPQARTFSETHRFHRALAPP